MWNIKKYILIFHDYRWNFPSLFTNNWTSKGKRGLIEYELTKVVSVSANIKEAIKQKLYLSWRGVEWKRMVQDLNWTKNFYLNSRNIEETTRGTVM